AGPSMATSRTFSRGPVPLLDGRAGPPRVARPSVQTPRSERTCASPHDAGVAVETGGELNRTAEGDVMTAVHFVCLEAEAVLGVSPGPSGGEQAVGAAEEISRRRLRPGLERPCVVVEDVLELALLVAGVRPPVPRAPAAAVDQRERRHRPFRLSTRRV